MFRKREQMGPELFQRHGRMHRGAVVKTCRLHWLKSTTFLPLLSFIYAS